MPSVKNRHEPMTHFPKQNLFVLFILFDGLQNIVWTVFDQYFGQPPRSTVDNLRYVLCSVSEKYYEQSPKTTSFYEIGTDSDIYIVDSLRESFAFLIYHRNLNTGSIIYRHSHPCHAMPRAKMQCKCHCMSFHATSTLRVTCNI